MREREINNKPPNNKHGTSKRKYETVLVKRRSPLMKPIATCKQSHFQQVHRLAAQRKKTEDARISSAALLRLFFLSLEVSERVPTDIANERLLQLQESDQAMVGPTAPGHLLCRCQSFVHKIYTKNFFWELVGMSLNPP